MFWICPGQKPGEKDPSKLYVLDVKREIEKVERYQGFKYAKEGFELITHKEYKELRASLYEPRFTIKMLFNDLLYPVSLADSSSALKFGSKSIPVK